MNRMRNVLKSLAVLMVLFVSANVVSAQQKIGHINYAEIITNLPEVQKIEKELQALDSVKTSEFQGMIDVFQRKRGEAEEMMRNRSEANKETVDPQIQKLGMELEDMERRITEFRELAQKELGEKQQQLLTPVHQKVATAIQNVGKEKGYAYIFDISGTNIPYFGGGDDLTADVKTKLGIK